jgi:hypothetical protein
MSTTLVLCGLAGLLALAGCATPGTLKRPLAAPTMARPSEADPLPAYATPDSRAHESLPTDRSGFS